jgi:hypothetical protein
MLFLLTRLGIKFESLLLRGSNIVSIEPMRESVFSHQGRKRNEPHFRSMGQSVESQRSRHVPNFRKQAGRVPAFCCEVQHARRRSDQSAPIGRGPEIDHRSPRRTAGPAQTLKSA